MKFSTRRSATTLLILILSQLSTLVHASSDNCSIGKHATIAAKVRFVYDGDTIALTQSYKNFAGKIRIMGINTPEHSTESSFPEPYAKEARDALIKLLKKENNQILMVTTKKPDRYGRLLAHVFTKSGINIQQYLLEQGLAFNLPYPPNLRFQACYKNAAQKARTLKRNIWQHKYYRPLDVTRLNEKNVHGLNPDEKMYGGRNFNHITGTVLSVRNSRRSIWINFKKNRLTIRIARNSLKYFTHFMPLELQSKKITVSGYISFNRSKHPRAAKYYMLVRHPDMIRIH